jgi:hypothetical protein
MWVIDIRHWLNDEGTRPGVPQLKLKVKKLAEIITYATSKETDLLVGKPPQCWRRPNRKPCNGRLNIHFTEDDRIYWICPKCGDEGVVDGFRGLVWDMNMNDDTIH